MPIAYVISLHKHQMLFSMYVLSYIHMGYKAKYALRIKWHLESRKSTRSRFLITFSKIKTVILFLRYACLSVLNPAWIGYILFMFHRPLKEIKLISDAVAVRWSFHKRWSVVVAWKFWCAKMEWSKEGQLSLDGFSGLFTDFFKFWTKRQR